MLSRQPMRLSGAESGMGKWGSCLAVDLRRSWQLHFCPLDFQILLERRTFIINLSDWILTVTAKIQKMFQQYALDLLMKACFAHFSGFPGTVTLFTAPKRPNESLTVSSDISRGNCPFSFAAENPFSALKRLPFKLRPLTCADMFMLCLPSTA